MIKVSKLKLSSTAGGGLEIRAHIDRPVNCMEFTLKGDHHQLVASEPWIQFPPEEWGDMIEKLFVEMIDAWNEKHGETHDQV